MTRQSLRSFTFSSKLCMLSTGKGRIRDVRQGTLTLIQRDRPKTSLLTHCLTRLFTAALSDPSNPTASLISINSPLLRYHLKLLVLFKSTRKHN